LIFAKKYSYTKKVIEGNPYLQYRLKCSEHRTYPKHWEY